MTLAACLFNSLLGLLRILLFLGEIHNQARSTFQGVKNGDSSTVPAPQFSGRAAYGDFDRDGDVDILYQTGGNGSAFEYARNDGGTYTIQAKAQSPFANVTIPEVNVTGASYRVEDFNNDGRLDIYVQVPNSQGSLLLNGASGFTTGSTASFPAPQFSGRAAYGDFDSDGDLDIYYQTGGNGSAQYTSDTGSLLRQPAQTLPAVGGSQPHENMQPYLVVNYIISLYGIYPSPQ